MQICQLDCCTTSINYSIITVSISIVAVTAVGQPAAARHRLGAGAALRPRRQGGLGARVAGAPTAALAAHAAAALIVSASTAILAAPGSDRGGAGG
jgi:hypothetical protein